MAKSHCTCTCIKSSKEFACCVRKHSKSTYVSHIMTIWDMRKSNTLTHNHNCLMGTITFEVHPITPTSPRNTLATIFKSILIFFAFIFFAFFFSFLAYHAWTYKREREREEIPNSYKPKISKFCYAEAHKCYTWLAGFSGEMVIYAFLLGIFSPSCQKE